MSSRSSSPGSPTLTTLPFTTNKPSASSWLPFTNEGSLSAARDSRSASGDGGVYKTAAVCPEELPAYAPTAPNRERAIIYFYFFIFYFFLCRLFFHGQGEALASRYETFTESQNAESGRSRPKA